MQSMNLPCAQLFERFSAFAAGIITLFCVFGCHSIINLNNLLISSFTKFGLLVTLIMAAILVISSIFPKVWFEKLFKHLCWLAIIMTLLLVTSIVVQLGSSLKYGNLLL